MLRATAVRAVRLFRVRGCVIRVEPVLLPALVYLGWTLTRRYASVVGLEGALSFHALLPAWGWALVVTVGALLGLAAHEAAHVVCGLALGARVRGITFAALGGRIDFAAPPPRAGLEWRAALAGPAASLVLALALFVLSQLHGGAQPDLHLALRDLVRFQVVLGLLNLIPAFPLDGGRAVWALLAPRLGPMGAARVTTTLGKGLAVAAAAVALAQREPVFLFLALFFYSGAIADERLELLSAPLRGRRVRDAMLPVVASASVHDAVGEAGLLLARHGATAIAILATDGAPIGAIGIGDVRRVAPEARWRLCLGTLLARIGGTVPAEADLAHVRRLLVSRRAAAAAVVGEDGTLVGVLPVEAIDRQAELAEIVGDERRLWGLQDRLRPA